MKVIIVMLVVLSFSFSHVHPDTAYIWVDVTTPETMTIDHRLWGSNQTQYAPADLTIYNPDYIQKVIKDLHSESEEIKTMKLESDSFDEKEFLSKELLSIGKKEFGVEVSVYSESDDNIYDPKGKARHARPFKPAILIE